MTPKNSLGSGTSLPSRSGMRSVVGSRSQHMLMRHASRQRRCAAMAINPGAISDVGVLVDACHSTRHTSSSP